MTPEDLAALMPARSPRPFEDREPVDLDALGVSGRPVDLVLLDEDPFPCCSREQAPNVASTNPEHVQRAWDALAPGVLAAHRALVDMVGAVQRLGLALRPDPAPSRSADPAAHALWAARNRGHGPPVAPPGARQRRR